MPETHRIQHDWKSRLARAVPFGIGHVKPKHFRDMINVVARNSDNLPYAWKVLSRGVCDGCALGVAGFHDWTIEGVHLCMTRLNLLRLNTVGAMDGRLLADIPALEKLDNRQMRELGRLPFPMIREGGAKAFRRVTWEEAYALMAGKLRGINPKRWAMFVTARGVTNEIYYTAQKTARFLGTNNIDNAARICHSPSTAAMKRTLGVAATTCSYKDWYGTDLVIFFGSNAANDQPLITKYLHEAKKLGTRVVTVNPYREPGMERYWVPSTASSALFGTDIMDYWFPVTQGGDIAFLFGVLKIILAEDWHNASFVRDHTTGFEELKAAVERQDWDELERKSGLSRASMREFAELIRDAKNAVLVWSMGITQHVFGSDAVQMILNLGLLRGYVGHDKNGLMPIRGHSSVQGGAEMGAYSTVFPGGKNVNRENAAALSAQYGFAVPDWVGLTTTEMVEAAARGDLDLLYCVGGNFLRTLPEPEEVRRAMSNVPLRVHQDVILNDQMLIPSKETTLILPARTRYEQEDGGTETTTERRIIFSPEIPRKVGEARSEWRIFRELAEAVSPERFVPFGCESGWKIREEIARVVPLYKGIQHLRKTGDAVQYAGPHLCKDGHFETPDGKARLRSVELPEERPQTGEFKVSTRRGKQFNSLIYAETDPLTGADRDAIFMNPEDAASLSLAQNEAISLKNDLGEYAGRVFLVPIARGNLQIMWPEGNVIIHRGRVDAGGGVPDYNAWVTVQRATVKV